MAPGIWLSNMAKDLDPASDEVMEGNGSATGGRCPGVGPGTLRILEAWTDHSLPDRGS